MPAQSRARRWILLSCLFVGALTLLPAALIVAVGLNDGSGRADLIVVPGNTVRSDGTPSPRLESRLQAALDAYRRQLAPRIFVSGGIGREGYDEAAVMAAYLIKNGVPPEAVVRDAKGSTTAATALNAARYMRENRLGSAIVATQYFHVARTAMALRCQGVTVAGTVHARFAEWRDVYSLAREVAGLAAYYVRTTCGPLAGA